MFIVHCEVFPPPDPAAYATQGMVAMCVAVVVADDGRLAVAV